MIIRISDQFSDDFTTRIAGEKLRKAIITANDRVILDFKNVKIASASFFDEGIAKLVEEDWSSSKINSQIEFLNMFKRDKELLINVCANRGLYLELA